MFILSLLPLLVVLVGGFLLFKLRFFFLISPGRVAAKIKGALGEKNAICSLSLSLAGTLGVGNIVGVAVGISVGGAGSIFWLLISSVFAIVIKYAEAALSCDMGNGLGMIGVVRKSFSQGSVFLSKLYAGLILVLSFLMGSALQSANIGECAFIGVGIKEEISSFLLVVLIILPVIFGSEKIEKITVFVIPLATIIYIILCFSSIIPNISKLPDAFLNVVASAFSKESVGGGIIGFLLSKGIKEGFCRGILSNEAGAGTSTLAHARNESTDPGAVGVMGMLEVFFDTVILCMLTAFATLVSLGDTGGKTGVEIILAGIGGVFGEVSRLLVFLSVFAFAYSTIICWYYYGVCAYRYLFCFKKEWFYTVLFLISSAIGAQISGDYLITLIDCVMLFLSLISLSALMKNSDRIVALSEKSGLLRLKS